MGHPRQVQILINEEIGSLLLRACTMVIARLVDRIEVGKGYTVHIQLKVALEQLIGKTA